MTETDLPDDVLAGVLVQATAWRHALHEIAETARQEHETAAFIARTLGELGLEVTTDIGGTGVVGTLRREAATGSTTPIIALRADMDGLPLTERSGLPYSSRHEGSMHACGHDGHMAMVLGAAAALAADDGFTGTARFLFQPAEEPGTGAIAMLDDGLLSRLPIDMIFGLHNIPGLPAGHLATRPGPIMAGEDNFVITITGRGGHASAPHLVVDPLVAAAAVVTGLQTIVARNTDPLSSAVLSCTNLRTDGARNAIPTEVVITGDTRNFDPEVSALLERRIRELSTAIARAHGATATVEYTREFATTANDPEATRRAVDAARAIAASPHDVDGECAPIMASEDFGRYADVIPANFTFIGNGASGQPGGTPLHSHDYRFNDEVLSTGIRYYVALIRSFANG